MVDTVKTFVKRQNIAHYIDQLKIEPDPRSARHALETIGRRGGEADQSLLDLTGYRPPSPRCDSCDGHVRNPSQFIVSLAWRCLVTIEGTYDHANR
jgi:hypothetical protein